MYGVLALLLLSGSTLFAQEIPKSPRRQEIDAKRTVLNVSSDEALPRSREFLRIDSTYYVGWLVEGMAKFNRAADVPGFLSASQSLETCLRHFERDYAQQLRTRTTDLSAYLKLYSLQTDYAQAVSTLVQCYTNTEQAQQSYSTIRRYLQWNFQRDFFDAYNMLMWVVHRNRIYTAAKYPFLQNSIDANEALAMRFLDSSVRRIDQSVAYNKNFFTPESYVPDYLGVYHYKAILYSYNFAIDSAQRYYDLLAEGGQPAHNNYGNFRAVCGDFRTAEQEYALSGVLETGDNRLEEWAYFSSLLNIYKAQPKSGIKLMDDVIRSHFSQPGYGWYQIAKARCEAYDGQIRNAEKTLEKASGFRELHIGTSLGQTHYDFAIQLQKLFQAQRRLEMVKFENRGWWYRPAALWEAARRKSVLTLQRFLIINQLARNPERERVLYKLFSTESIVGWDEIWTLISGFSTDYFLKKFQPQIAADPRPRIRKYFRYMTARLLLQDDQIEAARSQLNALSPVDAATDLDYEVLLFARKALALAKAADQDNDDQQRDEYLVEAAQLYPQLLPFSELRIPVRLQTEGAVDEKAVARLKKCNLNLEPGADALTVTLRFEKAGSKLIRVRYSTTTPNGTVIVPLQSCTYDATKPESAGIELAYRIFGVSGQLPEPNPQEITGF
jgi:hypothetical protein